MAIKSLVSIITPVYNQERYIEQTINSVLKQTYQNWEWIIIDDGSDDATKDIIRSYDDSRIRYFFQDHAGIDRICHTHNQALASAQGDFIALIDGDDIWPEDKLERQIPSFSNDEIVLSYGECRLIDSQGKAIDHIRLSHDSGIARNDPVGTSLCAFLLTANSFIYNPTVLIKKAALQKMGGFITYPGMAHDFTTWCTLSLEGKFAPLPRCLGYYRKHPASLTFQNPRYRLESKMSFIKDFTERHWNQIESLGVTITKEEIYRHTDARVQSFIEYFFYDRAMLMAKMGMFREARREFGLFLKENSSLKNTGIGLLFTLSEILQSDFVNPARKLRERIRGRRP